MPEEPIDTLAARLQRGDPEAAEQLFVRYADRLARLASQNLSSRLAARLDCADVVQSGSFGPIRTFAEYASPALKAKYLPALLAGRIVMSLGMSEPEAGSAATDLKTTVRTEGAHAVINGTKVFSTFSSDAEVFLI